MDYSRKYLASTTLISRIITPGSPLVDMAPANAMCFNGQLTKEAKEHIADQIQQEYGADISVLFFELKGEQAICPDDYTIEIKSE